MFALVSILVVYFCFILLLYSIHNFYNMKENIIGFGNLRNKTKTSVSNVTEIYQELLYTNQSTFSVFSTTIMNNNMLSKIIDNSTTTYSSTKSDIYYSLSNSFSTTNFYNKTSRILDDSILTSRVETQNEESSLLSTLLTTLNYFPISSESTQIDNSVNFSTTTSMVIYATSTKTFSSTLNQEKTLENLLITLKDIKSTISTESINETTLTFEQTTSPSCIDAISSASVTLNSSICTTISSYQPSFEYSFYFGYPILQIIGCNNAKIVLNCPQNHFLNIYSAYYGIQSQTQTLCTLSSSINSPSVCFRSDSFNLIYSLCQNKTSCYLYSNRAYFGDPCTGFDNKQLLVQYQCVDKLTLARLNSCPKITKVNSECPSLTSPFQYQQTWCDFTKITLTCLNNKILKILCAVYGIDPNIRSCGLYYTGSPTSCNSFSTLNKIREACNNKINCSLNINLLNNICPKSYAPILIIQYECIDMSTNIIPYCNTNSQMVTKTSTTSTTYKCSPYSAINPSFISSYDSNFNNFLINENIVCYGSKLNIYCKSNTLIHIYSAYFGIQSLTNSLCVTNNRLIDFEEPTQCFIPYSYDRIVQKCEYKNNCIIESTEIGLNISDPCPDFQSQEQLFVQYQCIESSLFNITLDQCDINTEIPFPCALNEMNINEGIWCDNGLGNGSILNILCPDDKLITILCSFYGLHSRMTTCNEQLNTLPICFYNNTITTLEILCNGKNSCILNDFNLTFMDACSGLSKTLYLKWICS